MCVCGVVWGGCGWCVCVYGVCMWVCGVVCVCVKQSECTYPVFVSPLYCSVMCKLYLKRSFVLAMKVRLIQAVKVKQSNYRPGQALRFPGG